MTRFLGNYDVIFQIAYNQEISRNPKFQASPRRAGVTDDDGDNYNRKLPNNFALVAGTNVIRSKEGDDTRNDEEGVYVGVNRSFIFFRNFVNIFISYFMIILTNNL